MVQYPCGHCTDTRLSQQREKDSLEELVTSPEGCPPGRPVRLERVLNTCVHAGLRATRKRVVRRSGQARVVCVQTEVRITAVAHRRNLDVEQRAPGDVVRTA